MQMPALENLKKLINRAPADVVGIDCASNAIRTVRMKKSGTLVEITACTLLPARPEIFSDEISPAKLEPLPLSSRLRGRFAALAAPSKPGAVKVLRVPESFDTNNRDEVLNRMALEKDLDARVSTTVILPGAPKVEARILAAILPEVQASALLKLLPAAGTPAPRLIDLSETCVINAFANDPRFATDETARGLIHFDHDFSLIALFNNTVLSQLRIFPFGAAAVSRKVMKALNVDQATAEGVITDGAFDISHLIEDGAREMRSQLVISRDFMERSENCTLEQLHVSGPSTLIKPFVEGMSTREQIIPWNVLEGFGEDSLKAIPEELAAEAWRLTAAIGAGLGVLLSP
jgi:Tfp pilus assembly PilM family ATPase